MTDSNGAIVWDDELQPFGESLPFTIGPLGYNAMKEFQMTINSELNYNYIVQASPTLGNLSWVSLATNNIPSTFTDANAANYKARFYRVVYTPSITSVVYNFFK